MDMHTDAHVKKLLETDLADCTCIAVAHRICKPSLVDEVGVESHTLSTASIANFDTVVVLQDGQVVENDNPRTLLRVENGVFRGLAQKQDVVSA